MLANHHVYYWLIQLGSLKLLLLIFSAALSGITLYVLGPFHLQRVSKLYRKYKPVRITQQKEHLLIWNLETTQAIFLATKHEKTI